MTTYALLLIAAAALTGLALARRLRRRPAAPEDAAEPVPPAPRPPAVAVSTNIESTGVDSVCASRPQPAPRPPGHEPLRVGSPEPEPLPNLVALADRLDGGAALRQQAGMTLLAVRLDDAERVTRCFGDVAGQRALQEVARTICRALRPGDACARWEADRFVAVLPAMDPPTARAVVARLRRAVRALSLVTHAGEELRLEVTVGSARCPDDGSTFDDLLLAAGRELESQATPAGADGDAGAAERLRRAVPVIPN